jgi:hypothetical protein
MFTAAGSVHFVNIKESGCLKKRIVESHDRIGSAQGQFHGTITMMKPLHDWLGDGKSAELTRPLYQSIHSIYDQHQ